MKTRILRFLLPAILVAAGFGSVAWTWGLARQVEHLEATGRQSAARIDRLEVLLDELTQDELIYTTSGQVDADTVNSTSNRLRLIVSESGWLLGQSLAAEALSAGAVAKAASSLAEVNARAQENIRAGLDLMAANLLFTETTRTRQRLREQLRALRIAESKAVGDGMSVFLKQAWIVLAGAALLFAWTLVRSGRTSPNAVAVDVVTDLPQSDHVPLNRLLKPESPSSIDLIEAAALCTAISRLQVETDLQALLVRTATLLNATGVVVWMTAGEEMLPVAWYGYDSRQLSQLGPIGPSSLNAIAAAWRSGALQKVSGDSTSRSAIVTPLLGVERCIGALAIEVTPGRETDVTLQAVTTLIAAQLVTVLGAWPAGSSIPPAAVLPFDRVSAST
jgi:hypothetical protein